MCFITKMPLFVGLMRGANCYSNASAIKFMAFIFHDIYSTSRFRVLKLFDRKSGCGFKYGVQGFHAAGGLTSKRRRPQK